MWASQAAGSGDEASSPESERMSDFEQRTAAAGSSSSPRLLDVRRAPAAGYSLAASALLQAHYALDGSPPWPFAAPPEEEAWKPDGQQQLPWVDQRQLLPCGQGTPVMIDWEALAGALEQLVKPAQASRRLEDVVIRPSFDRLCERLAHVASSAAPRSTQYKRSRTRAAAKAIDKCVRLWAPFLRRAEAAHPSNSAQPGSSASPHISTSPSRPTTPSNAMSDPPCDADSTIGTSPQLAEPDTQRSLLASSVERMWLQRKPRFEPRADVLDIDAHLTPLEALSQVQHLLQLHPKRILPAVDALGDLDVASSQSLPLYDGAEGRHLYVMGSAEQRAVVINHVALHTPGLGSTTTLILTQRGASTQSGNWAEAGVLPPPMPPSVACFESVVNFRYTGFAASPFRGIARAIATGSSTWIDMDTFAGDGRLVGLGSAVASNSERTTSAPTPLPLPTLASMAADVAGQAGASSSDLAGVLPESLLRHFDFAPYPCVSCHRLVHAPPTRAPLWSRLQQELPDDRSVSFYWACKQLEGLDRIVAEARKYGYLPAWTDYLFADAAARKRTPEAPRSVAVGGRGPWIQGLPDCEWRFCMACAGLHIRQAGSETCGCLMCSPMTQQRPPRYTVSKTWRRHVLDRPKLKF